MFKSMEKKETDEKSTNESLLPELSFQEFINAQEKNGRNFHFIREAVKEYGEYVVNRMMEKDKEVEGLSAAEKIEFKQRLLDQLSQDYQRYYRRILHSKNTKETTETTEKSSVPKSTPS